MQKINFQNLPSTTTPINATNLNAIQTNTENAINDVAGDLSDYVDGTTAMGSIKTTGVSINNVAVGKIAHYKYSGGTTSHSSGSYLPFITQIIDNMNDLIRPESNGLIDINFTGYLKITIQLWVLTTSIDARPWIQLMNYDNNTKLCDAITSSYNLYQSFSITDLIIPVTNGMHIGIKVNTQNGATFEVNAGTDAQLSSYITMERVG